MSKIKSTYICKECNFESPKWLGKCPNCNSWNSFAETMKAVSSSGFEQSGSGKPTVSNKNVFPGSQLQTLEEVITSKDFSQKKQVYEFNVNILNDFWSDGLVAGSLVLLAGEPGLGKSTLALQLLRSLYNTKQKTGLKLVYVTAEESLFELARRATRLEIPKQIILLQSNNFEQIEKTLETHKPNVAIVDSIQTVFSLEISSSSGSVTQVSFLASQFLILAKKLNITVILIGHVTKEGSIAGPKTLEHLVDTVLTLELSKASNYRTLTFNKHRYGSTDKQLLLKMQGQGLDIITDPSLALLENLETGTGVCYGICMEKNMPMMVEIQALVAHPSSSGGGNFFGRREAIGCKVSKLNTILAISEKYLGLDMKARDVYIQLTGLSQNTQDDSLDLPILLAILSSLANQPIENLPFINQKKDMKLAFAGRLTLSGNMRNATYLEVREQATKKLGFKFNPGIEFGSIKQNLHF